ncbi:MAG: glyoxalase [Bacteroidota bacterium]
MSINRTILQKIRPVLSTQPTTTEIEQFQNEVLRPILKFQHELLIALFRHYIKQRKDVFRKLQPKKQLDYIQHSISKDGKLRELLIGMIIGHFTSEEWLSYLTYEKPIRKRMIDLMVQRVQDTVTEL